MSYLNHHTGYRQDLLTTRSVIRKGQFALLDPDGLVRNTIPGFSQCDVTILASPLLGASFVDYLVTAAPGGSCREFGAAGEELFLYVLQGSLRAWNQEQSGMLEAGGYKCGLFTSPHLVKINERFQINEEMVSDETFLEVFCQVKELADSLVEKGDYHPTYFEFLFQGLFSFYQNFCCFYFP